MLRVLLWTGEEIVVPIDLDVMFSADTMIRVLDLQPTASDYVFFCEGRRWDIFGRLPEAMQKRREVTVSVVPREWLIGDRMYNQTRESVQCMSVFPGRSLPEVPAPQNFNRFGERFVMDTFLNMPEGHMLRESRWTDDDDDDDDDDGWFGFEPLDVPFGMVPEDDMIYDEDVWLDDMYDESSDLLEEEEEARDGDGIRAGAQAILALRDRLTPEELQQVEGLARDYHVSQFMALQVFMACDKNAEQAANILQSERR